MPQTSLKPETSKFKYDTSCLGSNSYPKCEHEDYMPQPSDHSKKLQVQDGPRVLQYREAPQNIGQSLNRMWMNQSCKMPARDESHVPLIGPRPSETCLCSLYAGITLGKQNLPESPIPLN